MDLFDYMRENTQKQEAPLASRLRPRTLDEIVGQKHILGKDKLLYRAIRADKLSSLIFYGPPGTGKTTIARVIANTTKADFTQLNATVAGKKDMEAVVNRAKDNLGMYGRKTILFVDEIHRFNKGQQDYLLPFVEDGTVILIGATTENPYFEVNGALLSRSVIFELKALEKSDILELIHRALTDKERGMGAYQAEITDEAADFLADIAGGDARSALNAIELGVLTTEPSGDGRIHLTLEVMSECIQKRTVRYDKTGDNHYDTISAFIKSMRGSDPDAAVYYLGRLLVAGDLLSPCRRLLVIAAEDIGLAYPQAIAITKACVDSALQLGLPEARLPLAEAAILLATAPKSNSAHNAIIAAMSDIEHGRVGQVPRHLQNVHADSAGSAKAPAYRYPHNYPHHYVRQQYLPDALKDAHYYDYGENKTEQAAKRYWDEIKGGS